MHIAILTISTLSLAASVGTLLIMAKTAQELKAAKTKVETDVEDFKAKTNRNLTRIRSTLGEMEL